MNKLEQHIQYAIAQFKWKCLLGDTDIKNYFGISASGIDHVLFVGDDDRDEVSEGGFKYLITIQDKWEQTPPKNKDISTFIYASQFIEQKHPYQIGLALFVSKMPMNKEGQQILSQENQKLPQDKFIAIHNSTSESVLAQEVSKLIQEFLTTCNKLNTNTLNSGKSQIRNNNLLTKTQWSLYPHQKKVVDTFINDYLNGSLKTGVVCQPTGTGKTITALAIINQFWKKYPTRSVLWITKRKDILRTQFENPHKLRRCIESGIFPNYSFFKLFQWYYGNADIDLLNQELQKDQPIFLVTNIACIKTDDRYQLINSTKFSLIILDECHLIIFP